MHVITMCVCDTVTAECWRGNMAVKTEGWTEIKRILRERQGGFFVFWRSSETLNTAAVLAGSWDWIKNLFYAIWIHPFSFSVS